MLSLVLAALISISSAADKKEPFSLNINTAKQIAEKAQAFADKNKWDISIAIVDAGGNLLYFQRDQDAYIGSVDSSVEKAKSANAFKRATSAFVEGVQKNARTGLISGSNIVAIEGGVPIASGGKHFGAIGISGARAVEDEQIAKAAVEGL